MPTRQKRKAQAVEDSEETTTGNNNSHPAGNSASKLIKTSSNPVIFVQAQPAPAVEDMPRAMPTLPAPDFKADAVMPDGDFKEISLSQYKGKYVLLFFYPLDFTFVCPTEIIELSDRMDEFKQLNTQILGCSVDSKYSHLAWRERERKQGGLGPIGYPLIADLTKKIAQDYGVLLPSGDHTLRGTFIIDDKGVIRHVTMNEPPISRNVDEYLRIISAAQFVDANGEVCPSGWKPGKDGMKPDPKAAKEYFASH